MANTKIALPIRNEYLENGEKKTNRKTPSVYSQEAKQTIQLLYFYFYSTYRLFAIKLSARLLVLYHSTKNRSCVGENSITIYPGITNYSKRKTCVSNSICK